MEMTSHERILRTFQHKETDRVPILDSPWGGTLRRWVREGMPQGMDWRDYFGTDKMEEIGVDISPRYECRVIEETDEYVINTTPWGVTLKNFKLEDSTPEFIDYKVQDARAWADAKIRMMDDTNRYDLNYLKENFPKWRADGRWIRGNFWFGFDVTHSWMVGTETVLIALMEEPEWVTDMFETYLNACIRNFNRIWDAGYHFDSIFWPDDMGYKGTPFFSNRIYRELLQPYHKKAVDWAHERGIFAHLHSCGDIMPLLPDILATGIDCLNPIEIKAGMDAEAIKKQYGDKLVLHGGVNAVLWDDKEAIVEKIRRLVPVLKEGSGYIFSSDHSIPNSVSLENFREIIATVKEVGRF